MQDVEPSAHDSGALVSLLSLLFTPTVLFVSSANRLYLRNQADLHHHVEVLGPFLLAFCVAYALGVAVWLWARRGGPTWPRDAYYAAGPYFLIFAFLQNLPEGLRLFAYVFDTTAGFLLLLAGFVVVVRRLRRRIAPARLAAPLAAMGVVLLAWEALVFARERSAPPPPAPSLAAFVRPGASDGPNVYHVLFDSYQADVFALTLRPDVVAALDGFVFFPRARALYGATTHSLPTIFNGRDLARDVAWPEYLARTFHGSASFVDALKRAGYVSVALSPPIYPFEPTVFDHFVYHAAHVEHDRLVGLDARSFRRLWLYVNAPRVVSRWVEETPRFATVDATGEGDRGLIEQGKALGPASPILSYLSFERWLEEEAALPPRGRYTFVHLLIPHVPDVFGPDCAYRWDGTRTDPLSSAECATRLLGALVGRLRELDRYDDALVVVHGDHGAYVRVENGNVSKAESMSMSTVLLFKPPGRRERWTVCDEPASLVDIAPTVLGVLGVPSSLPFEGRDLSRVWSGETEETRCRTEPPVPMAGLATTSAAGRP